MSETNYDVAIIGGGPGGSTTGALLRKYDPTLRVVILEQARFPRDHVGESQLPPLGAILHEMGCWDEVERAGFPIKIGATYRWGRSDRLWDFEFLPAQEFSDEPRPAPYAGQRVRTALQVDRATYDDILLRRAGSLGCEVRQQTRVQAIQMQGDRVTGLRLRDGGSVEARHYVDASGHAGTLRRAAGVEVEVPTRLKNIAIWDYWHNAAWAVHIGVGGTRIQVMSQPNGWLWFIPLGPTRTSIGLVLPAHYYKQSGRNAEDLYLEAVRGDPRIGMLCEGATRRGETESTTDWSFVSQRCTGANWMLVGESIGFADPILAAGLTLTQTGAREAAYTILALREGELDPGWLLSHYDRTQRARIRQHIRFAEFWYASNGQLTDLKEHCRRIAEDAGLRLDADDAWGWLAQGGFTHDTVGQAGIGGLDLAGMKQIAQRFLGQPATWLTSQYNVFELDVRGAQRDPVPIYKRGKVQQAQALHRDGRRLALTSLFGLIASLTHKPIAADELMARLKAVLATQLGPQRVELGVHHAVQALETMLSEGWIIGSRDASAGTISLKTPDEGANIHANRDGE